MALTKTPIELSSTPGIVDNSNNTAITINSSENVGIGIGLPASLLDVASTGEVTSTVRSTSTSGARQATLRLNVPSTGGDDPAGRVQFTYGMGYTVAGSIEMSHTLNNMKFLTGTTERMRIDSSGNVLVGKTNTGDYVAGIEMQPAGAILSYRTSGVASIFGRTDSGEITRFTSGGAIIGSIDASTTGHIAINAATGTGKLKVGGVVRYNWDANQFYPQQDNARDLGFPSFRWDDVYSTGGINTSDRNEKQDIEELSNAEQRVAVACKGLMRKFRWKSAVIDKGDDARIHVGIMAQDLQAAFESEGLDPARYGMWCSNTWTDEETSEEITRMSVRYNELLAFIISAI